MNILLNYILTLRDVLVGICCGSCGQEGTDPLSRVYTVKRSNLVAFVRESDKFR